MSFILLLRQNIFGFPKLIMHEPAPSIHPYTTFRIHISGQVQGVGFRPFVYQLANSLELTGWVNNSLDGVHIEVSGNEEVICNFYQHIIRHPPLLARITHHHFEKISTKSFDIFSIRESNETGVANLLLSPDFALCESCKNELFDPNNRRFSYPFITCTLCGPRYSVIQKLPYDRPNTSMQSFEMCPECHSEYNTTTDKRYFAQTISCNNCSITMQLFNTKTHFSSQLNDNHWIIDRVVRAWQRGEIVAIKGIGGYLLTCDATRSEAIKTLRQRKHRPSKPFALMYPNAEVLSQDVHLTDSVLNQLNSPESPIVLADAKEKLASGLAKEEIAPFLLQLGVMLPYAPLFALLLSKFGKPIVATSGNVSHSPIVFSDEKALDELGTIADWIVTNNREIVVPQDDSVITFSKNRTIFLRRSRGIAPTFIQPNLDVPQDSVLAMGADMKSTFMLTHHKNLYVSQYLGDLESYDTQESYRQTLHHFLSLFEVKPTQIVTDSHPQYFSTQLGKDLAEQWNIPVLAIQHHQAHFGAVLAENNLIHSSEPILGVIWDGTGLGTDGNIWGGEFFIYQNYEFLRESHFNYFPFILGDKMPRQPRISALAACATITEAETILEKKFSPTEWKLYRKMIADSLGNTASLQTSSVGRLFDAVASLLGLADQVSYEGEAAMRLESCAKHYIKQHGSAFETSYLENESWEKQLPTQALIKEIVMDILAQKPVDYIAAKFHYSLAIYIKNIAKNLNIKKIAFSGGVFQNTLLVDLIEHYASAEFELYFHRQFSPNDESCSFGQWVCWKIKQMG